MVENNSIEILKEKEKENKTDDGERYYLITTKYSEWTCDNFLYRTNGKCFDGMFIGFSGKGKETYTVNFDEAKIYTREEVDSLNSYPILTKEEILDESIMRYLYFVNVKDINILGVITECINDYGDSEGKVLYKEGNGY